LNYGVLRVYFQEVQGLFRKIARALNEGVRGFYSDPLIVDRAARTKEEWETGAGGGDCSPEHGLRGGASPEMAYLGHLGLI
jgi:hypothetical protein